MLCHRQARPMSAIETEGISYRRGSATPILRVFQLSPLFPQSYAGYRPALRARVLAAFLAEADLAAAERLAEAALPLRPPFFAGALLTGLPFPDPLFLPPPVILLTVAHARRSASSSPTPRSLYPFSLCSA